MQENGALYGNYYVAGELGGIDGIGYEGGAAPLAYEDFRELKGLPEAFSHFTVTFLADGKELASYQCEYGDSLTEDEIPKVPEKEGLYGHWPEFDFTYITGNRVLEAQYEKWVSVLKNGETDADGRTKILVEGQFVPGARLEITREGEAVTFAVENGSSAYIGPVQVRVLCEETDGATVQVLAEDGFQDVESRMIGSYLVFPMEKPGTFRVTAVEKHSMIKWYAAGAGAAGIFLLIMLGRKAGKRKAAKKKATKKKAAGRTDVSETEKQEQKQDS